MDDVTRREQLGLAIRAAMKAEGITQEELAERLGKSPTTVGRWVRGDTVPTVLEVGPLATALRVSPMLFIDPPAVPAYPIEDYRLVSGVTAAAQARAFEPRERPPDGEASDG